MLSASNCCLQNLRTLRVSTAVPFIVSGNLIICVLCVNRYETAYFMRRKFLHRVEGGGAKSYDDTGLRCYQLYNDGGGRSYQ